jgi:hypothetical protein
MALTSHKGRNHCLQTGRLLTDHYPRMKDCEIKFQLLNIEELLYLPGSIHRKRTLKKDAEEFFIEEAEALPRKEPITVTVYLASSEVQYKEDIPSAIQKHFCYRKLQSQREFRRTLGYGWRMLLIAMGLLVVLYAVTEIAVKLNPDTRLILFIRESFIILGWVALWRPLELLLYDWYPIRAKINLFARLEKSKVVVEVNDSKEK